MCVCVHAHAFARVYEVWDPWITLSPDLTLIQGHCYVSVLRPDTQQQQSLGQQQSLTISHVHMLGDLLPHAVVQVANLLLCLDKSCLNSSFPTPECQQVMYGIKVLPMLKQKKGQLHSYFLVIDRTEALFIKCIILQMYWCIWLKTRTKTSLVKFSVIATSCS